MGSQGEKRPKQSGDQKKRTAENLRGKEIAGKRKIEGRKRKYGFSQSAIDA